MYIKSLNTSGFGPFSKISLEFIPNEINIIMGKNSSGKTQLFGALKVCIEGKRYLETYKNETETFVKITIVEDGENYELGYRINKSGRLESVSTGECFINSIHQCLSFDNMPSMFINELTTYRELKLEKSSFDNEVIDNLIGVIGEDNVSEYFCSEQKIHSNSKQFLHIIISEYLLRKTNDLMVPLAVDLHLFDCFEQKFDFIIWNLLDLIAKDCQLFIFSHSCPEKYQNNVVFFLEQKHSRTPSSMFYKEANEKLIKPKLTKRNVKNRYKYLLNDILNNDEDLNTEYKEVKGSNAVNSIKDVADQYVVAFLNSPSRTKGKIIWGINDSDKKVVGVKLNYGQRDDLRRNLINKLHDIQPIIPPSCYRVTMHQVAQKNRLIEDLYVVEVTVLPFKNEFLFCTSKKEVFVKTDGGKKKLTPYEVQLEYKRRIKSDS